MDCRSETYSRNNRVHSEEGIDAWIKDGLNSFWDHILSGLTLGDAISVNVWGHKLPHFKRIALGHIVPDEFWTKYDINSDRPGKGADEVIQYAFVRRGLHTRRYRD